MKKHINLYQPSCYPKREKATFVQFLAVFFICVVAVLLTYYISDNRTQKLQANLSSSQTSIAQQQATLVELVDQLQKKRAPDEMLRRYDLLQNEVVAKQRVIASLAGIDIEDLVTFSTLMRGLSHANMDDLSIKHFSMVEGVLNINGEAKYSDSVPLWLSNMQSTPELSSVAFKALSIEEVDGLFNFKLTNSKGKATNE